MDFHATCQNRAALPDSSPLNELKIILVSDFHNCIDPEIRPWMPGGAYCATERRELVIRTLKNNNADLTIWLGDLVDRGHVPSYRPIDQAMQQSQLPGDVFVTPGNHDIREVLRDNVRSDTPTDICTDGQKTHYLIKRGKHNLFVLDSAPVDEFEANGAAANISQFGKVGQEWLRGTLDSMEQGAAAWVFTHYPANNFNQSWITGSAMMRDGDDLHAILVAHQSKVGGVFSGHLHHAFSWTRDDINYHSLIPASVALTLDRSKDKQQIVEDTEGFPGVEALTLRGSKDYSRRSLPILSRSD